MRAKDNIGDGFDIRSLAVAYRDGFTVGEHNHPWGQLIYAISGVMRVSRATRSGLFHRHVPFGYLRGDPTELSCRATLACAPYISRPSVR